MTPRDGWAEAAWGADKTLARWYERDNPTNLTPAQVIAQQAVYDAGRALPYGITADSVTRADCRTIKANTETRDPSETGGGGMTCAEWGTLAIIVCAVVLLALVFWPA